MNMAKARFFLFGIVSAISISCFTQDESKYVELDPCSSAYPLTKHSGENEVLDSIVITRTPIPDHRMAVVCYDTNFGIHAFIEVSRKANVKVDINKHRIIDSELNTGVYDISLFTEIKDKNSIAIYWADSLVFDLLFLKKK